VADPVPLSDAMRNPADREHIEQLVALMRMALAPVFNADPDAIPMNQSFAMTAAALFAGMTAGHMIAFGVLLERDKRRAGQIMLSNFRNGIEMGKQEAQKAILSQSEPRGSA
jgi:hypothetical protein